MTSIIISGLFRQLFFYSLAAAIGIKVYSKMKTDKLTFGQYIVRQKSRVIIAMLFILFTVAYSFYIMNKI